MNKSNKAFLRGHLFSFHLFISLLFSLCGMTTATAGDCSYIARGTELQHQLQSNRSIVFMAFTESALEEIVMGFGDPPEGCDEWIQSPSSDSTIIIKNEQGQKLAELQTDKNGKAFWDIPTEETGNLSAELLVYSSVVATTDIDISGLSPSATTNEGTPDTTHHPKGYLIHAQLPVANHAKGIRIAKNEPIVLVEATLDVIKFNGKKILQHNQGQLATSDTSGWNIFPLYEAGKSFREKTYPKSSKRRRQIVKDNIKVLLAMDTRLPTQLFKQILFSLGQAQYHEFLMLVDDKQVEPWRKRGKRTGHALVASALGNGRVKMTPKYSTYRNPPIETTLSRLNDYVWQSSSFTLGCARIDMNPNWSYGSTIAINDHLYKNGAVEILLGGGSGPNEYSHSLINGQVTANPTLIPTGDLIPVFPTILPPISPNNQTRVEEAGLCNSNDYTSAFLSVNEIEERKRQQQEPRNLMGIDGIHLGGPGIQKGSEGFGLAGGRLSGLGNKGNKRKGTISGPPIVLGPLDKSIIEAVVKENLDKVNACYKDALNKRPNLAGRIRIKFVVLKDGSVPKSTVEKSSMGSDTVENCINDLFMEFEFPKPKGNGIVMVKYPFIFQHD